MGQIKSILLVLTFLMTATVYGQNSPIHGPKAKNAKPWQKKAKGESVYVYVDKTSLKSPEAKNQRVWEAGNATVVKVRSDNTLKLKGYEEKNRKPWASN